MPPLKRKFYIDLHLSAGWSIGVSVGLETKCSTLNIFLPLCLGVTILGTVDAPR